MMDGSTLLVVSAVILAPLERGLYRVLEPAVAEGASSLAAIFPCLSIVNSHGSVRTSNASSGGRSPFFTSLST